MKHSLLILKNIPKVIIIFGFIVSILLIIPANAVAMSEEQRQLYRQGSLYYDLDEKCVVTDNSEVSKEQKIAQTLIVGFDSQNDAGIKEAVEKHKIGGIFPVGSGSYEKLTKEFFESLNTAAGAKLFIASDDEGGQVTRFADGYPSALEMGSLTAEEAKTKGAEMGQLLTDRGLNADLAPVLDLQTQNGFMSASQRVWSSDPAKVIANAGAWAEGLKSKGITPTYKHFPGIGKLTQNTDEGKPAAVSLADLLEDLKPFRELANKHGGAVMLSNGYITEWGEDPIGLNKNAVEFLKNDIKFNGTIMTDALNRLDIHDAKYNLPTTVVSALNAGVDMPLFVGDEDSANISKNVDDVIKAVAAEVTDSRIDEAYAKSLELRGISGASGGSVTNVSSPSTDLGGFDPDPAAVDYFENQAIYEGGKTMKQLIEEYKPLYVKAAADAGLADWEILPALHNLESTLSKKNPPINEGNPMHTIFQMSRTGLRSQGVDISRPLYTGGHELTDEEFIEVATQAAKGWIIIDAAGLGFDATRGLTPEEAAKTAVAYKSGGGSDWLNGTLDFKGHAYAWAGYNKEEFKFPMAYAPGSINTDEQPSTLISKPGVATVFALLKQYGGGTATLSGDCTCSSDLSGGSTVFLDPGHGVPPENKVDPNTGEKDVDPESGLKDLEYMNADEAKDVWKIANDAKSELEKAGYTVTLSKSSVDEAANFREKSNRANDSKASIGVSIHTTGGSTDYTWGQKVGAYRDYGDKKVEFSDQTIADKSQQFVSIFNSVRAETEKVNPSTEYVSYDHVKAMGGSGGNLALIMLWAKIPWVYLEKATGTSGNVNRPLTEQEIKDYTATVVDGVKRAVPPSGTSTGSVDCNSSSGVNPATLEEAVKSYVWEDGSHGTDKKPAYKEIIEKRKRENKYVGADGIDCGGFVTTLMQESGLDPEYGNKGPTGTQQKYLEDNANKYQKLGILKDSNELQPGDIAIWNAGGVETQGNAGHTYIYTGKIDGFKGNSAEASLGERAPYSVDAYFPNCERENQSYCQQFTWFRLLK